MHDLREGTTDARFMEIIERGEPLDPARWSEQDLYDKVLPRMHLVVDAARPPPRAGGRAAALQNGLHPV